MNSGHVCYQNKILKVGHLVKLFCGFIEFPSGDENDIFEMMRFVVDASDVSQCLLRAISCLINLLGG